MLQFLNSVFTGTRERRAAPDKNLIERAIQRVVDGTDPRLRGLINYRKRLRPAVEKAVVHVLAMVDDLPEPAEISRRAYSVDPCLRAFFVSSSHLLEVIGNSKAIRDYIRNTTDTLPDEIFGVLAMEWKEKNVFGMELVGDTVQRDVAQVAVSFFNHRYVGPSGNETETRRQVAIRIFDYLIEQALARIVAARSKRTELKQQQRLLKRKLDTMKSGNWGLKPMFGKTETPEPDHVALESEIKAIEAQLFELGAGPRSLEACCENIDETLGRPADWVAQRKIDLKLDDMLIKVDAASTRRANQLELTELFSSTGERRVVMPGRFPRQELPEQPDFLEQAKRYLR
jgi:hypothetical protein